MLRRSVRLSLVLLTVAITAAAIWRATTTEQARGRMRLSAQQADAAVADVIFTLADLRATFYAMLAPGQGDFWPTRAADQLDDLRRRLLEVDAESSAAGHPLASSLDRLDRLADAAARTRALVANHRAVDAAPVALTEARELVDAVTSDLSAARRDLARAASSREAGMANEQSLLAGAVMSIWIVTLILLVPVPRLPTPPEPTGLSLASDPTDAAASLELAPPAAPAAAPPAADPQPPLAPPAEPKPDIGALAALCSDLGRVSQASDLQPLLARTADLLGARGVVVWLLDANTHRLVPAMAHGYDTEVLARVGSLGLDEQNLTVRAFQGGAMTATTAAADHAAAVAVPILSAAGPSGVLAAELDAGSVDVAGAMAGVIAAQLANLFPAAEAAEAPVADAAADAQMT